jgi:hypothetical protein
MSSKSPPRDFTPISLLKRCKVVVAPLIARLANLSSGGSFPDCFKIARITSLLKGHDLDSNNQASYQPISNLNTISKLLERLVLARPQGHTINSRDVSQLQSEYRRHNSTETATNSRIPQAYYSLSIAPDQIQISNLKLFFIYKHNVIRYLQNNYNTFDTVLRHSPDYKLKRRNVTKPKLNVTQQFTTRLSNWLQQKPQHDSSGRSGKHHESSDFHPTSTQHRRTYRWPQPTR